MALQKGTVPKRVRSTHSDRRERRIPGKVRRALARRRDRGHDGPTSEESEVQQWHAEPAQPAFQRGHTEPVHRIVKIPPLRPNEGTQFIEVSVRPLMRSRPPETE